MLKDGHVGSEWFAETISRQPGTKFLFEMGPCITGSLATKMAFFSSARRGCTCTKEDCALFRGDTGVRAPCLDAPSRSACRVLGGSHISMASERELHQWEQVLANGSDTLIVVQTRSNLVKWAWSFYRTGAMDKLRRREHAASTAIPAGPAPFAAASAPAPTQGKQKIHLRASDDPSDGTRVSAAPMHVDPWVMLRMIIAKQVRSERLMLTARRFALLTPQKRERVLLYEAMQADFQGEVKHTLAPTHFLVLLLAQRSYNPVPHRASYRILAFLSCRSFIFPTFLLP